jgi:hypothetical protein
MFLSTIPSYANLSLLKVTTPQELKLHEHCCDIRNLEVYN